MITRTFEIKAVAAATVGGKYGIAVELAKAFHERHGMGYQGNINHSGWGFANATVNATGDSLVVSSYEAELRRNGLIR